MTATHGPVGDIRFDETGEIRCYWCGARSFTEKRTGRAKVAGAVAAVTVVGAVVGAAGVLATKKKMRCHRCGTYNRTGSGKPWTGPEAGRNLPSNPGRFTAHTLRAEYEAARLYRAEYEAERREAGDDDGPTRLDQ